MSTQSSMLHVRIDDQLKQNAAAILANFGLTISDAVRILLTRVEKEGALPVGLTTDPEAYDEWFRNKVKEAMEDDRPKISHAKAMAAIRANLDTKTK
ncbi:DNA-damage-inducible protein J [Sinorhizobium medicae]|uniref:type II toxin-antitoxin system RelB/DinJ family antitoxin n=1 Tax=Rhizobiaceae TaxID=82115 RepID=UPI00119980DE|nr:type II toxin-antitoxin system RelB/DinJ family antitoxin [Sinorhizobium medicae]MQU73596.1 type II toxin-antitoxin system RelB/DinJ family antitoxin [Sinorhizobium medicae]TWA33344.1 DNA-damage-inducible protein J [Sinorhizobium medicae]